jgi:hypothetical protein
VSSLGKSRTRLPSSARRHVGATRPGGVATGRPTRPAVRWHPLVRKMFPPARHVWNSQPVLVVRQGARGCVAVGKSLTWVVGLVAAVSAILIWFPTIQSQLAWRQVEYSKIAQLHAGESVAFVTGVLGKPAIVHGFGSAPKLIESLYLRRDYNVMVLGDAAGRAVILSVMSCDKDFQPSFQTPGGTTITLQKAPLNRAEVSDIPAQKHRTAEINDERRLVYAPAFTGSSLDQAIETGAGSGTDAARTQSWWVGVNGACGSTAALATANISGATKASVPAVAAYRKHTAANFYAESAVAVDAEITSEGNLYLDQYGAKPEDGDTDVFVTPFSFDMPIASLNHGGTRTF